MSNESSETVTDTSVLIKDSSENDFYCIIISEDGTYLAKYGTDMKLKLKSTVQVKPQTPVNITDNGITVTDINGKIMLLQKQDLSPLK